MLYFILIWNILMTSCMGIGLRVLYFFPSQVLQRKGDRIIVSLWIGLLIFALSLMGMSLLLPVSLGLSALTLVILGGAGLLFAPSRQELKTLLKACGKSGLIKLLALELGIAALINRPMVWFDTGFYHVGIMRWLNQYGVVPGVAQINGSFGFTSAWFPFSAPLTSDLFGNKIGAVTNGFVFLLATIAIIILGRQGYRQSARLSDYFGYCFFSLTAIAYGVTVFTGAPILISFSPDVAITFLTGIIAWLILIIQTPKPSSPDALSPSPSKFLHIQALVPMFAAAAFSIKLSAIPVVAIALLFYAHRHGSFDIRRGLIGLLIILGMSVPMLTFGTLTAGCPLYPTRVFCLDLPWTLSAARSHDALQPIAVLKGENRLPNLFEIQDWIWLLGKRVQLFLISSEARGMIVLAIVSLVMVGFIVFQLKRQTPQGQLWVLGLGVVGSLFILGTAPLIRFGLGYFSLIPALTMAMTMMRFQSQFLALAQSLSNKRTSQPIGTIGWLFLLGWVGSLLTSADVQSRLLQPPKLPTVQLASATINQVTYQYPKDFQYKCWNSPIPCTPLLLEHNIDFRNPDIGLSGGFLKLHTTTSEP